MSKITIIAAVAKNGAIGLRGELLWHIPEDLTHFKKLTTGHAVLMGRKTFDSIIARLGKPLPHRTNIVISRETGYRVPDGVLLYRSIDEALTAHKDEEVFIAGGGEIYRTFLPLANKMYITYVDKTYEADTFFPPIPRDHWRVVEREEHDGYTFLTYEKRASWPFSPSAVR